MGQNKRSKRSYIKVNIISAIVYIIVAVIMFSLSTLLVPKNLDANGWESLVIFARGIVLSGVGLIIYSIIFPIFISVRESYGTTFINYISIIICNVLVGIFVIVVFNNTKLATVYLSITILGMILTSFIKYSLVSSKKNIDHR